MATSGGRRLTNYSFSRERRAQLAAGGLLRGPQPEDPDLVHRQSPLSTLDPTSEHYLNAIARALGVVGEGQGAISSDWRCVWTLGNWVYPSGLAVACSMIQPLISSATVKMQGETHSLLTIRDEFVRAGAQPSSVTVREYRNSSQVQGRLSLAAYHAAVDRGLTVRHPGDTVAFLNVGGSKLTFWLLYEGYDPIFCYLGADSLKILVRYLPAGYTFVTQSTSRGGWHLVRSGQLAGDADYSYLGVSPVGNLQFNGKPSGMTGLYSALASAIRTALSGQGSGAFVGSLQVLDIDT